MLKEVWRQEMAARWTKAVALAHTGSVDMVGRSRKEEVELEGGMGHGYEEPELCHQSHIRHPTNLHQWFGEDPASYLCTKPASLRHILTGCRNSLTQGRDTYRHNQVLKSLASTMERKLSSINALPVSSAWRPAFVCLGQSWQEQLYTIREKPSVTSMQLEDAVKCQQTVGIPLRDCHYPPEA